MSASIHQLRRDLEPLVTAEQSTNINNTHRETGGLQNLSNPLRDATKSLNASERPRKKNTSHRSESKGQRNDENIVNPVSRAFCEQDLDASLSELDRTLPIGDDNNGHIPDFKPAPLRAGFLGILLLVILLLMSLTELAVHTLPNEKSEEIPWVEVSKSNTTNQIELKVEQGAVHYIRQSNNPVLLRANASSKIVGGTTASVVRDQNNSRTERSSLARIQNRSPKEIVKVVEAGVITETTKICTHTSYFKGAVSADTVTVTIEVADDTPTIRPIQTRSISSQITTTASMSSAYTECATWTTVYLLQQKCGVCEDDTDDYVSVGRNTVTVTIDNRVTTSRNMQESSNSGIADIKQSNTTPEQIFTLAPTSLQLTTTTVSHTVDTYPESTTSEPPALHTSTIPQQVNIISETPKDESIGKDRATQTLTNTENLPHSMSSASESVAAATITGGMGLWGISTDIDPPVPISTTRIITSVNQDGNTFMSTKVDIYTPHINLLGPSTSNAGFLTTISKTLTDSNGQPTATSSYIAYASQTLRTLTNAAGKPSGTETLVVIQSGLSTAILGPDRTSMETLTYFWIPSTRTLTDPEGRPISTVTSLIPEAISTSVLTDDKGTTTKVVTLLNPLFTSASNPAEPKASDPSSFVGNDCTNSTELQVYEITQGEYFLGLIVPALLATLLGIPIRAIDYNAKLYQPFHALATSQINGASASQSLLFSTKGPMSTLKSFTAVHDGQALIRLTGALMLLSGILVPVSAEAVRITIKGNNCRIGRGNSQNCAITLGVFPVPATVAVAILATMAMILIFAYILLRNWKTGVRTKSWNMSSILELASNPELHGLLNQVHERGVLENHGVQNVFRHKHYSLGFWDDRGNPKYGVFIVENSSTPTKRERPGEPRVPIDPNQEDGGIKATPNRPTMPTFMLTVTGRLLTLALILGLVILIAIYPGLRNTGVDFATFMDSESIGVRILFSGTGIIITMFWTSYFQYCALLSPYRLISANQSLPMNVYKLDPSTNPFSGLVRFVTGNQHDIYLGVVAVVSIMSEFLPTLLTNVPHRVVETYLAHTVCMWLSVVILCIMILTILASFLITWPHMPIDPSTMVGAMYYVVVRDGTSALSYTELLKSPM